MITLVLNIVMFDKCWQQNGENWRFPLARFGRPNEISKSTVPIGPNRANGKRQCLKIFFNKIRYL